MSKDTQLRDAVDPRFTQRDIADWLEERNPELANTYRATRRLLEEEPEPGYERTRVLLICHAMREIINRLPATLLPGGGALNRSSVASGKHSGELVQALPELRVKYPDMDLSLEAPTIPIPREVALVLDQLIDAAEYEDRQRLSDLAAFLTEDANPKHPAVHEWRELSRYFTRWAHLGDTPAASIPTDQELTEKIRVFEDHIDAIGRAFFANKSVIEDMLFSANEFVTGELSGARHLIPDGSVVEAALRRLTTYQLRRVFYEGLENPYWVKPLAELGAFVDPPEPVFAGDGYVYDAFWPEISYLERVCTAVPSDVVDVLLGLATTSNSWVRRAAFAIGSRVPVAEAVRMKPLWQEWGKSGGFGWRTDPRDLVSFAVNLLNGGQVDAGVSFSNILFRPQKAAGGGSSAVTGLDRYWYSAELPRLVEALGPVGLQTVLPWLVEYERITEAFGEGFDHSGFFRASIGGQPADRRLSIENALIDAVRACAVTAFSTETEAAWFVFEQNSILISQRIAMYAVAECLDKTDARNDPEAAPLVALGEKMLLLPKCREQGARLEFVALARELARHSKWRELERAIEDGHFTGEDRERLRTDMIAAGMASEEIEPEISRLDDCWRHEVLSGVGRELLSPALVSRLDQLDEAYGVLENPLRPSFQVTSWCGPNSPVDYDEMVSMSPSELVAQLESWHMTGDPIGPRPSHEGQARVLEDVLAVKPRALGDVADLVGRLRPTYIRAALRGWKEAFQKGCVLDWRVVVETTAHVVSHGLESRFPSEGKEFDDDPDYVDAKWAAAVLLVELSKPSNRGRIPSQWLAQVANLILDVMRYDKAREARVASGLSDSMDDLVTVAPNQQQPIRIRALVNLISHGGQTDWYEPAIAALERELNCIDLGGASYAALGETCGQLLSYAPQWMRENVARYFGSESHSTSGQQVAVAQAVALHYYHPELYRLLSGPMIAILRESSVVATRVFDEFSVKVRIGEWIINAIIRGDIDESDDLRHMFYETVPPDVRGEAIGRVAWSFAHVDVVDDAIRDRLGALWDERVRHVEVNSSDKAELKDFCWFVRSGRFNHDWWLPRLKRVLKLYPEFDTQGMIGEQIAQAALTMPGDALDLLITLLEPENLTSHDTLLLRIQALAPVIAAALDTGDQGLMKTATDFMNEMGARGEIDLDRRVAALRGGIED
jgi:hypothetical protein